MGQLTIFLAYLAQFYDPLNQLSHLGTTVSDASTGVKRVFEILDTPEEINEAPAERRAIIRRTGAWHPLFMNLLPDRPTSRRAALGHWTFEVAATEGPVALRRVQDPCAGHLGTWAL